VPLALRDHMKNQLFRVKAKAKVKDKEEEEVVDK
jgi:hypothetical protein